MLGTAIAWLSLTEVALLLGGAIFLILLLIKPLLSLYVLIPLIPFSSLFTVSAGGARVGLMEIILFLGVAVWLLQVSVKPDQNIPRPPAAAIMAILVNAGRGLVILAQYPVPRGQSG